jgi:hypothetical protein
MGGEDFRLLLWCDDPSPTSCGALTTAVCNGMVGVACCSLIPVMSPLLMSVVIGCVNLRAAMGSAEKEGASNPKTCLVPPLFTAFGDITPFLGDLEGEKCMFRRETPFVCPPIS